MRRGRGKDDTFLGNWEDAEKGCWDDRGDEEPVLLEETTRAWFVQPTGSSRWRVNTRQAGTGVDQCVLGNFYCTVAASAWTVSVQQAGSL